MNYAEFDQLPEPIQARVWAVIHNDYLDCVIEKALRDRQRSGAMGGDFALWETEFL